MPLELHIRACLLLLLTTVSHASTYYVSAAGNDANNGTTQSTAWKTIAKINASTFQPGDSILFHRGDTWRETLTPPSSGATDTPITFGNYGSGPLPVITGADLIPSAAWIVESTYYYHPGHASQPSGVWTNGTRLTPAASKSAVTSSSLWWYDSANQRVYVFNAGSAPTTIEIQTRDYNIDTASNPKSHLVFDGLDLQKARQNFRLYSWSAAASDWTIQNSTLQSEPNPGDISAGIYASSNTGSFNGVTVRNNIFSPWPGTPLTYVNNAYGVYFTGAPGRVPVTNFLIDNNTIGPAGKHGICVWHASIGTVSNNTLGGNSESCIDVKDTPYATITRNRCDNDGEYSIVYHASDTIGSTHDGIVSFNHVTRGGQNQGIDHGHGANQIGDIALHATQNVTVAYNWVETSFGAGIYVNDYASVGGGNNNTVMYNVVANNGTGKVDAGISLGDVVSANVFNNTVHSQKSNGNAISLTGGPHTTGTQIDNNLLYGTATAAIVNVATAGQAGFLSDHNLFFNTQSPLLLTWGSSTGDLAAWRAATSQDTHSVSADPNFVNETAGDLRLDFTSPAIDAGSDLGATSTALDPASTYPWSTVDQDSRGSAWDIGAFAQQATTTYGRGAGASGWFTIGPNPTQQASVTLKAAPPLAVPDPTECDSAADISKAIPGDYPASCTGLNSALTAWASAPDQTWDISVAAGTDFGLCTMTFPAKTNATRCIRFHSSTPLQAGQTACSHGIQDPVAIVPGSTDPGVRNFGCDGTNLSYQSGSTTIPVAPNSAYNDRAKMWTLRFGMSGGQNSPAIACGALDSNGYGCHHIKLSDFEVAPDASALGHQGFKFTAIQLYSTPQSTLNSAPSHIWFDRFHWTSNLPDNPLTVAQGGGGQYAEFGNYAFFDCTWCGITNGYTEQIGSITGAESHVLETLNSPGKILSDHNWIESSSINWMWGGNITLVPNVVTSDVTITRTRFTKPLSWMQYGAVGSFLTLKNDFEFKRINRFVCDGCIFENSTAGAQDGQCFGMTTRVASGAVYTDNSYATTVSNVALRNSILRHCANGIQTDSRSDGNGNGNGSAMPGRNWSFYNNLIYDIGNAAVYGTHTPNYILRLASAGNAWQGCTATRNSAGTQATIDCTASTSATTGYLQHSMSTGDLIYVSNCVDTTFNTGASPAQGPHATFADPSTLVATYPSAGPANAATSGCTLNNTQGLPSDVDWIHNTVVAQNSTMSCLQSNWWNIGLTAKDSICAIDTGIGFRASLPSPFGVQQEGTRSETYLDQSSFEFHHLLFGQRTASNFTEYPGAGAATVNPPSTIWTPPISCATANASTEGCIGFAGMMSGAGFQLNLPDWHGYALHTSSPYKSNANRAASDNKDLGADLSAIDRAQTTAPQ